MPQLTVHVVDHYRQNMLQRQSGSCWCLRCWHLAAWQLHRLGLAMCLPSCSRRQHISSASYQQVCKWYGTASSAVKLFLCSPTRNAPVLVRCAGSATCVLGRVYSAATASHDGANDGAMPDAAVEQPTLWPGASKRIMLHASTVRYLRYGPRRPPAPTAKPAAASHPSESAAPGRSPAGGTAQQAASKQPAAADAHLNAAGATVRQLARQRLEAAPSGIRCFATLYVLSLCAGVRLAAEAAWQLMLSTPRRTATSVYLHPGCRGWRHYTLAEAWQGSTVTTAPSVLHDLAICTAEAVAQAYLGEVRRVLPVCSAVV